jgi:hypothetical protein
VNDGEFIADVRRMMNDHWRAELGYTVPNPIVYPWLWLWDSCFHSLVWAALTDDRALTEMHAVFGAQRSSGFLPHINYGRGSETFLGLWGVSSSSTITQPPLYGHVLRKLAERGYDVRPLLPLATTAMRRLFEVRLAPCGLLRIFHPWESGIDDGVRWERWQGYGWTSSDWHETKLRLVRALRVSEGEAIGSSEFEVCPAGFNALAAWNALELVALTGDQELESAASSLIKAIDRLWIPELLTWGDGLPDGSLSSAVRTLDALLVTLVTEDGDSAHQALDTASARDAFNMPFGPAGVDVRETSYSPSDYHRGSSWPQLTFLMWLGARRWNRQGVASELAAHLAEGASVSGLAEYWDPRNGHGLGARPHAWAGLAIVPLAELAECSLYP